MIGHLNFLAAHERDSQLRHSARRGRQLDDGRTPVTGITLRYANAGDRERLHHLAELDSAETPTGSILVAVVDGRLRAALPLEGGRPIADPFHRGSELIELLRMRAAQLA